MLTAVTERVGHVIRFNDAFLDFLRVFKIVPLACNVGAASRKKEKWSGVYHIYAGIFGR